MDKISGFPQGAPYLPPKKDDLSKTKKSPAKTTGFLGLLKTQEASDEAAQTGGPLGASGTAATEAEVEALLDAVYATGHELARYPSPENVLAYKKTIGRFVQLIVSGSLELTEVEGRLRKDMKKPKYALLQVIDEKLDKLGAYVLSNQKDHMEILRKVDELHGLLVDLRH